MIQDEEWEIKIDAKAVGNNARRQIAAIHTTSREEAIHEGLGLLMAGFAYLHANGSHRGTVHGWVISYLNKLYGNVN
jgi:hypothetical protein